MEEVRDRPNDLYERDFVEWSEQQARLLRERRLADVDLGGLIEEVDGLSASVRSALNSQTVRLLVHLLKWMRQPRRRSQSWRNTILDARLQIELLLDQSPSLRRQLIADLSVNYGRAIRKAAGETGLSAKAFPAEPPFTIEQVLDDDFWPE